MTSEAVTALGRILEEEGRKQTWLAEQVGTSRQRIHLLVHGLHPSDDEAQAIADALGRTREELWPTEVPAA